MSNKIWQIILVISLIIVVISGVNVFRLSREYQKGINEYEKLEQYVSLEENNAATNQQNDDTQETEEQESKISVSVNVKYDELKKINEDFVGWIYYEPLEISYPIVRGNDNDYYTEYTFENVENSSGAIFMDFLNRKDYMDFNTIIYGHNMRNGTMFGSLKKLLNDQEIIEENPYFYIFTEDKAYMYEIFAVYITTADSQTYDLIKNEEEEKQKEYLDFIDKTATYRSDKEVTEADRIATLSTCHGLHSNNRTIVHGVLVAEEDR